MKHRWKICFIKEYIGEYRSIYKCTNCNFLKFTYDNGQIFLCKSENISDFISLMTPENNSHYTENENELLSCNDCLMMSVME